MQLIQAVKNLWPQLLALLIALHALLGAINAVLPANKDPGWLRKLVDLLGALPQDGMKGAWGGYSPPLMRSRPDPDNNEEKK